jgi:hypothetical protein
MICIKTLNVHVECMCVCIYNNFDIMYMNELGHFKNEVESLFIQILKALLGHIFMYLI